MPKIVYGNPLVRNQSKTHKVSATALASALTLTQVSKALVFANIGSKTVFISFDDEVVTADSFPIPSNTTLTIEGQFAIVNAICGGSDTTDLRVINIW